MADKGEGILQLIRMALDEASAKQTTKDMQDALDKGTDSKKAKENVKETDNAFERLGKTVRRVVEFMIARALVRAVINFGKEAVAAALESRKEWGLLANAVQNAGTSFAQVEARTKAVAQSFIDAGVAGDEEFAASLRTLIQISGDYEKSLANMQVVADLAAAKQMSLEEAAMLVGRAMEGQVTQFKRMGIEIPVGSDAVAFLAERFKGAADAIDPTVRAQIRLSQEWDNFKESVGEAILALGNGGSILENLTAIVKTLTKVVEENKDGFEALGNVAIWLVKGPLILLVSLTSGFAEAAALAGEGALLWDKAMAGLAGMVGASHEKIDAEIKSIEKFTERAHAAANATALLAQGIAGIGGAPVPTGVTKVPRGAIGGAVVMAQGKGEKKTREETFADEERKRDAQIRAAQDAMEFDNLRAEGLQKLIELQDELNAKLKDENLTFEEKVAIQQDLKTVQEAILGGLKQIAAEAGITQNVLAKALKGDAKGTLAELKKEAVGRAAWNVAKALEETGRALGWIGLGNFPSAAAAKASAAVHWASAAKWGLLAGGAALGAGGNGNAAGGAGTTPENAGGETANQLRGPGVEVTIYVDGIDPDNTRHQAKIAAINQEVKERYGEDSQVTMITGRAA